MATQIELLLDKLQSIHDRAIVLDTPRSFFLTLYEYIEVFDKDERLEPVIKTIQNLKTQDFIKSTELEKKALKEMRTTFKEIKDHIEKTGLDKPRSKEAIGHFEAYERDDGSIESSVGPLSGRHGCIVSALICIADQPEDIHKKFARKLGETNTEGTIIYWSFSPSYSAWEKEQKYIERLQQTKIWYDWDKLCFFFGIYRDYEKWRQELSDKRKIFNLIGLDNMFKELQDVMSYKNDPKRYLRTFDVPAHKTHLQKIHSYTKEILLTAEQTLDDNNPQKNWSYDPTSGVLNLNGKFVPFKKNNFRAKLLKLLNQDEESKERIWSWDEVYEEIYQSYLKMQKIMYDWTVTNVKLLVN